MSSPTAQLLDALTAYGYKRETIEKWPIERAVATLHACVRDMQLGMARSVRKAKSVDHEPGQTPRAVASQLERNAAADFLEETTAPNDVIGAIWAVTCYLSDAEARTVRDQLIAMLRTPTHAETT